MGLIKDRQNAYVYSTLNKIKKYKRKKAKRGKKK